MRRIASRRYQNGAVIVTASMILLFLLGFMGIALDFGRLFVIKTELQTAMDSCALAAAQELNGQCAGTCTGLDNPLDRARAVGQAAGNQNFVDMQSQTWGGQPQILDTDITFRDGSYNPTNDPIAARYAQCQHTHSNIQMWLLHTMAAFSGGAPEYASTRNVTASAVATRASAQSTCPLPLAMRPKPGGTAPNYGFVAGEWVVLLHAQNAAAGGQIGWANLDGSNSAAETEAEMNGFCGTEIGDTLGTSGVQASIADAWNSRFGIYKNNSGPDRPYRNPDFTGYSYTATNWPSQANAYSDFLTRRSQFASCAPSGTVAGCSTLTGLNLNGGGFNSLATAGPNGQHAQYGSSRRIATVPIVNAANSVIDYACMLMLHPISIGGGGGGGAIQNVQLEFIGNASVPSSPCTTSGLAGGVSGPLVPVLVR
ncbi:Tad domain-containing protein [Noviherbaspirillum sp.]|uniref:Tad domain-containing protein n=1 Tax=Noviherbaspirillum sp. TaxID=1926288 RepID=UPI002FE0222F